ncbi:MAG: hypothetical protein J5486_03060 [Bacteroidaceae bacterium]|nr:hypothetical protein [Bacteroidaceae bacterium]
MKKTFNVLLALCVVGLLFICYRSIQGDIDFQAEVKVREDAVKARLIEIRKAQEQYKLQHEGVYCNTLTELIAFVKDGRIPIVYREGELSDEQREAGLTDVKAAAIVNSGDAAAIAANGLQGFRYDTTWVSLVDSLYGPGFAADELKEIPFSEGDTFELSTFYGPNRSETIIYVMECCAPDTSFLKNMGSAGQRLIDNRAKTAREFQKYPGLKIGVLDIDRWNNNAGNWEE